MPYVNPEFLDCHQITPETCNKEIKFKGLLTYLINFMLNRNMDDMLETGQQGKRCSGPWEIAFGASGTSHTDYAPWQASTTEETL